MPSNGAASDCGICNFLHGQARPESQQSTAPSGIRKDPSFIRPHCERLSTSSLSLAERRAKSRLAPIHPADMRRLLVVCAAVAVGGLVTATTQAHNTKWSWSESYAEGRVIKVVKYRDPYGELSRADGAPCFREAQQRHDVVKRQSDSCSCGYDELTAAIWDLSVAEDYYAEAKNGHPAVRARLHWQRPCGSGGFRFKHFRCVVIVHFAPAPYGNEGSSCVQAWPGLCACARQDAARLPVDLARSRNLLAWLVDVCVADPLGATFGIGRHHGCISEIEDAKFHERIDLCAEVRSRRAARSANGTRSEPRARAVGDEVVGRGAHNRDVGARKLRDVLRVGHAGVREESRVVRLVRKSEFTPALEWVDHRAIIACSRAAQSGRRPSALRQTPLS